MEKVTYLLGAGASAQCLPVVNEMSERISKIASLKKEDRAYVFGQYIDIPKSIEDDLKWLNDACKSHYSIDTFAKKLYLSENDKENGKQYIRLKNILSLYLSIEQTLNSPDKRYDNFWASILNDDGDFPKQLQIISWNYDTQLESSYCKFVSSPISFLEDNNHLFKLNGTIKTIELGKDAHSKYLAHDSVKNHVDNLFYESLFESYELLQSNSAKENKENKFSFAWEHEPKLNSDYYKSLKSSAIGTKVLVVIGYSFPLFNRKIDKLIINKYMPNLKKVYFQAPDAENLKERFLAITNRIKEKNMFLRRDKYQFTFPNELDI